MTDATQDHAAKRPEDRWEYKMFRDAGRTHKQALVLLKRLDGGVSYDESC